MLKSQSPAERDDTIHSVSVTTDAKAEAAGVDNSDLDIGHKENQLPIETPDTPSMTFGEGHVLDSTQLTDRENSNDKDGSENIDFAVSLLEQCKADLSLPNIDSVIYLFRQGLKQRRASHTLNFNALHGGLASALGLRCLYTNHPASFFKCLVIERWIQGNKFMIISGGNDDSNTKEMFEVAQRSLADCSKSTSLSAINTIIFLMQQYLSVLPPGHPKRRVALKILAYGMYMRFHHSSDISDVNSAISSLQSAAQANRGDEEQEIGALQQFLAVVAARRDNTRNSAGVNRTKKGSFTIQSRENVMAEVREDVSLLAYAQSLIEKFDTSGNINDLEQGIALTQSGLTKIPISSSNYFVGLNNLASALWTRFSQRGDVQDLDEAISLHRQALELVPPPHPNRSGSLNNLAVVLRTRFDQGGEAQDLNEAISFHRQALELRPPPHPDRSGSLNNIAIALKTRFDQRGDAQDLDDAISFFRQTLELFPPLHPHRSVSLNNLAGSLSTRFNQRGDAQDLHEAISCHKQALELRPPPHPHRSASLNNLAGALSIRFDQWGDAQDLHEAISFHKQALELVPSPHPDRSRSLNNLAIVLSNRFNKLGNTQDLNQAISFFRQALELRPPPHARRPTSLTNLAVALSTRFDQQGDAHDLNEAILFHEQALELIPLPHPDRSASLNNLAVALLIRFQQLGDTSHLKQAMLVFSEATHSISQSASVRFRHAKTWAHHADQFQHPSAVDAFDVALATLPELAALGLDIQSRQDSLTTETDGIARKAARCAIRIGNLDKAVEFLETGRSVFWSQFLNLRSPLDQLREVAPQLEENLRRISKELEEGSHRDKSIGVMDNRQKISWEEEAQQFEQLAKQWKETVNKVRGLDGFEEFLQPQRLSKLQTAAKGHPIIYLVANDDASSCLIMTSTYVQHIPLPNLPTRSLFQLVKLVQIAASEHQLPRTFIDGIVANWTDFPQPVMEALQDLMDPEEERGMRRERRIPKHLSSDNIFQFVLRRLWDGAVKPIIDFLGLEKSRKPPIVTWCTTGWFTFLPIHAAGCYDEGLVDCSSDYIISSYTPTIGTLLTSNLPPIDPFKMMAVIESHSLPSTREELERIERHIAGDSLIKFGTPGAPASVEAVASRLSTASIVHFACHGKQDSTKPLESGLEIGHERLTISRIMKESVRNGSLAFLSACETAMGDEKIPDEAMNIGASLLFTGFRSVVATMWKMWDKDGPVIADAFYTELFKGPDGNPMPLPDTSKSAEALSVAVNELRTRGVPFKRWVPFIHMGK